MQVEESKVPISDKAVHPYARAFAAWIAGYQNFYEPIVRAWFEDQGLSNVEPRTINGKNLLPSLTKLELTANATAHPRHRWAIEELKRKTANQRCRVQLDLLLKTGDGLITGECKSWNGAGAIANWELIEHFFVKEPDCLFLFLPEIHGLPVVESYLVLWKRPPDHDQSEQKLSAIYGRPVRLFYLDEIFYSLGVRSRQEVKDRLAMFDEASGLVRKMLTTSVQPESGSADVAIAEVFQVSPVLSDNQRATL